MKTNLLHLHYFYQVAKAGSVTAASLQLKIQQPALSIMLKKFEGSLGFSVFEKKGRRLQLTDRGQEVFKYAEEVFAKVQKFEEFIGQKDDEPKGQLRIATNDLIGNFLLAPVLTKWLVQYPRVEVTVLNLTAQEACEKMIKDEIDLGFFFHGPDEMSGIEIEKIKKIPFNCVGAKKHDRQFIGSREVDYSLTKKFPTFEKLKRKNSQYRISLNTNGLLLHKELALAGAGAVVLPRFSISKEMKQKSLINLLPDEKLEFSMKLFQRKNKVLSTAHELFIEKVIEQIEASVKLDS